MMDQNAKQQIITVDPNFSGQASLEGAQWNVGPRKYAKSLKAYTAHIIRRQKESCGESERKQYPLEWQNND